LASVIYCTGTAYLWIWTSARSFKILKPIFFVQVLQCVCVSAAYSGVVLAPNGKSDGSSSPVSNCRSPRTWLVRSLFSLSRTHQTLHCHCCHLWTYLSWEMPQEISRNKWQYLSPLQVASGGNVIHLNKKVKSISATFCEALNNVQRGSYISSVICLVTAGSRPTMNIIHETMHYVLLHCIKPCDDKYSNMYTY
jgi:hypothetical protein